MKNDIFKVNITLEKIVAMIGIMGAVYTMGSKLWADRTDVEIIKVKQEAIHEKVNKMSGQIDLIHGAFVAAGEIK